MCGVAGICRFDEKAIDPVEIASLTDAVAHRGPDGKGVWVNPEKTLVLGHRRLAILDLSDAGHQPMCYNGRYWIAFNGEIYNFIEIKNELMQKGYAFSTQTDTEVVLASYQEWGVEMLPRFNGMWAFALYDMHEKSILLSRDRFGVKPLYYHATKDKLIFSSEVQAIHKILGTDHPVNTMVISHLMQGHFTHHGTRQTYLQDVFNLPGGYNLEIREDRIELHEWYQLKKVTVPASFREQAATLKNLIEDACRLRLRSDVPVGTCLSGGVDSGSITAMINAHHSRDDERSRHYTHRSFCATFQNTPLDESESAKRLADVLDAKLDNVVVSPPQLHELEEAMRACDGPMNSLAFYPIWVLYRHIKQQGITVTLDGQGPDEMLGGYCPLYEGLDAAFKKADLVWFVDLYRTYKEQGECSQWSSKKAAQETLKRFFQHAFFSLKNRASKKISSLFDGTSSENGKTRDEETGQLMPARQHHEMSNSFDSSLFAQFFQSPLPGILHQYDRCSMSNSVECRMPFMDYRIVEFIFSLPPESKVGGGYTKRILREAMKGILPDETRLNKFKIGFNAPIVDWFRGPLRTFMLDQMNNGTFLNSEYFDGEKIRNDFETFLGKSDPQFADAWKFWPPVHLTWWLDYNKAEKRNSQ